jgi:hypothetical protein
MKLFALIMEEARDLRLEFDTSRHRRFHAKAKAHMDEHGFCYATAILWVPYGCSDASWKVQCLHAHKRAAVENMLALKAVDARLKAKNRSDEINTLEYRVVRVYNKEGDA